LGPTALHAFLPRHRRIALDTSVFIYQVEAKARYVELTDSVFAWLSPARLHSRHVHDHNDRVAGACVPRCALLTTYPHLEWIAPSLDIAWITR
jgi:hypothetical protein